MKRITTLAAALLSASVWAATMSASNGKDRVIITDAPCPSNIAQQIKPEYRDQFLQAFALIQGFPAEGCWIQADKDTVYIWLDGGFGVEVPVDALKPESGV